MFVSERKGGRSPTATVTRRKEGIGGISPQEGKEGPPTLMRGQGREKKGKRSIGSPSRAGKRSSSLLVRERMSNALTQAEGRKNS